ncbi:MAG: hypothetical protein ACLU4N_01025 [Butyricimonas faecihominis]
MRHIFLCGCFFLFSFLAHGQKDSTVTVNEAQLYRMGKQLVVSMQINVSRKLASNESLVLIPQLRDSLKNFMEFPVSILTGVDNISSICVIPNNLFKRVIWRFVGKMTLSDNSIFTFRPLRGVDEPFCSFS